MSDLLTGYECRQCLIKRLRTERSVYDAELCEEAAAEIERLRVALKNIWHRAPTNGEDVSFAIANKALAEVNDE